MDLGIVIDQFDVEPGFYILSYEREGVEPVAMPLWAVRGQQSQVFMTVELAGDLAAAGEPESDRAGIGVMSVELPGDLARPGGPICWIALDDGA